MATLHSSSFPHLRAAGLLFSLLTILLACRASQAPSGEPNSDFVRAMNLGKAYLENRDSAAAVEAFSTAVALNGSPAALRNLARGHLLARDAEAALAVLAEAAKLEDESVATSYLRGIAAARQADFEQALPYFEQAVRLDPGSPTLRFQLASAYQTLKRHEQAITHLRETLRLDPLNSAAHYKLSIYAQNAGDRREYQARRRDFLRLRKLLGDEDRNPEALEHCVYTLAESLPTLREPPPGIPVRFADATAETFPAAGDQPAVDSATATAVVDVDAAGRATLLFAGSGASHLFRATPDGGFVRDPLPLTIGVEGDVRTAVGNFHDVVPTDARYDPGSDGKNDVLLLHAGGLRLLQGTAADSFDEVTERAGLDGVAGRRAGWIDYDADGDLDLAVATAHGLELWQNNGDGTFEEVAASVGLGDAGPLTDVAVADLDGNVVLDLVAAGEESTRVYENQRTGTFRVRPDPPGPWPAARRVLVDDLDHDGHPDTALLTGPRILIVPAGTAERQRLDLSGIEAATMAFLDFDNDGWLDLVAAGAEAASPERGSLRLWRNGGAGDWRDVTAATGLVDLSLAAVREITAADLDADGDTDLLLTTAAGARFLRNDGGERNGQIKLRLVGTKTNPGGLGTRVEIRRGDLWLTRTVSRLPVEIGLGTREPLDALRVVWTNGIVDNQIDIPVGAAPLTLVEKNIAAGSCPFLYAWSGTDFRFVTDLLGNSPLGLSRERGVALDADPDELVYLGAAGDFPARAGRYVVQVTEEMREVLYLDQARLIAVDHPTGMEVHPTDKLMPPPFPRSEIQALVRTRSPIAVRSDDGVERTAALQAIDGTFAPPGSPLPPQLRGMTRPLTLTFDFGPLDVSRPLVLALTGWLQWGDASTNIALSQGAAPVLPPRLEVETAAGFQPVDVVVGLPAGKTKTILVDLEGSLPAGARRLRLSTTFEVRWDRVSLGEKPPSGTVAKSMLAPIAAELSWRGFSEIRSRAPGHPTTPRHAAISERPPWRTSLQGWATRYGDALDLVTARDGRLALVAGGDALELAFDAAALPPVPAGQIRSFFFFSTGWDKDGDPNVIDGDRIEPLPQGPPATAANDGWRLSYNTRWVARDRFDPTPSRPRR